MIINQFLFKQKLGGQIIFSMGGQFQLVYALNQVVFIISHFGVR